MNDKTNHKIDLRRISSNVRAKWIERLKIPSIHHMSVLQRLIKYRLKFFRQSDSQVCFSCVWPHFFGVYIKALPPPNESLMMTHMDHTSLFMIKLTRVSYKTHQRNIHSTQSQVVHISNLDTRKEYCLPRPVLVRKTGKKGINKF